MFSVRDSQGSIRKKDITALPNRPGVPGMSKSDRTVSTEEPHLGSQPYTRAHKTNEPRTAELSPPPVAVMLTSTYYAPVGRSHRDVHVPGLPSQENPPPPYVIRARPHVTR